MRVEPPRQKIKKKAENACTRHDMPPSPASLPPQHPSLPACVRNEKQYGGFCNDTYTLPPNHKQPPSFGSNEKQKSTRTPNPSTLLYTRKSRSFLLLSFSSLGVLIVLCFVFFCILCSFVVCTSSQLVHTYHISKRAHVPFPPSPPSPPN